MNLRACNPALQQWAKRTLRFATRARHMGSKA
jgi:hypothetical protein